MFGARLADARCCCMCHARRCDRRFGSFAASDVLHSCGSDVRLMLESQFLPAELRSCGVEAAAMRASGCTVHQLQSAGFSLRQLKTGGCSALELKDAGCRARSPRQHSLSIADCSQLTITHRYNCCELFANGFSAHALRQAGWSAVDVKHSGCSARAMKVRRLIAKNKTLPQECSV